MSAAVGTRTELVEGLIERYPEIPPEAVLKEDLLRTGMAFDDSALTENLDGAVKPKSYFIFCLLYTSPSPRDRQKSRMPSSA